MVSAARLRSVVWAFKWPQPHSGARGFRRRECRQELPRPGESPAGGTGTRGCSAASGLFTSPGPTPAAAGPPVQRGAIGRQACQSPGTFPGVGQPGSWHFLVPAPSQEPEVCRPGRYPAAPSPERPWSPGLTRREGAVPHGPHPPVSLPGLSEDGGGGRESETGRSAPQPWPGMEWEVRPRPVAWGSRLPGNGA